MSSSDSSTLTTPEAIPVNPNNVTPVDIAKAGAAIVIAPPSNIRVTPNGDVICQVTQMQAINVYNAQNGWYETDFCGIPGYIHISQVK